MSTTVIYRASLESMTQAQNLTYHTTVSKYISLHTPAALGIPTAKVTEYKALIATLQVYVNAMRSSAYTPEVQSALRTRNDLYLRTRGLICFAKYSSSSEVQSAYTLLKSRILEVYPPLHYLGESLAATAQIDGFVNDLSSTDLEEEVKLLGLTDELTQLKAANALFRQQYMARNTEYSEQERGAAAKARLATDAAYKDLALIIASRALLTSDNEEEQASYKECALLSKEICALIEDNKLRTQLRQATKRQAKEAAAAAAASATAASATSTSAAASATAAPAASATSATSTSDEGAPVPTDSGEEAA
jgi:hypothetical protein